MPLNCNNCGGNPWSRGLAAAPSWYDNIINAASAEAENIWNDVEQGVWELGNALGPGSSPMIAYPTPDIGNTGNASQPYQTGDVGYQSQLANSVALQNAPQAGASLITGILPCFDKSCLVKDLIWIIGIVIAARLASDSVRGK